MVNLLPDTSFYNKQPQGAGGQGGSLLDLLKLVQAVKGADQTASQNTSAANTGDASDAINAAAGPPGTSTPAPVRIASQKLADMYQDAEQDYGLPEGYLSMTGGIESSHNPRSYNELSKAAGLMQFIPSTARQYGLKNPYDPEASIDAAARLAVDNRNQLAKALGRDPTAGELYLAHQQGVGGAINLLSHPNAPAGSLVPSPRNISANGGNPNAPASQFTQKWTSRFDNTAQSASAYAPEEAKGKSAAAYTPGGDDDPAMQRHLQKKDTPSTTKPDFTPENKESLDKARTFTPGGDDDPAMQRHLTKEKEEGPGNESSFATRPTPEAQLKSDDPVKYYGQKYGIPALSALLQARKAGNAPLFAAGGAAGLASGAVGEGASAVASGGAAAARVLGPIIGKGVLQGAAQYVGGPVAVEALDQLLLGGRMTKTLFDLFKSAAGK